MFVEGMKLRVNLKQNILITKCHKKIEEKILTYARLEKILTYAYIDEEMHELLS